VADVVVVVVSESVLKVFTVDHSFDADASNCSLTDSGDCEEDAVVVNVLLVLRCAILTVIFSFFCLVSFLLEWLFFTAAVLC